jgi:predicted esterase
MSIFFSGARRGATGVLAVALMLAAGFAQPGLAQPANAPAPGDGPPRGPMTIQADPRVEQRIYRFEDTDEDLAYTVFVSSKVDPETPAPLIVALHGLGGDSNFIVRDRLVDLAEENGYVVIGPLGYNVGGWYGSPVIVMGGGEVDPPNLTELSEKDVMNVLAMAREEFNINSDRTYLMGHSMGGAGAIFLGQKHAGQWAAIAAIAPAAFMMQPTQRDILRPLQDSGVPVMITEGSIDDVVPPEGVRTWAVAMEEMGMEHEYIEMDGLNHGTIIGGSMPDIFRFFESHTRGD